MAVEIFNKDNTELDGTVETVTVTTVSTVERDKTLIHYYNNLDQSVDVIVTGSRNGDDAFDEGVQLNSETVSSGGNAGFYVVSDPWEKVQVSFDPAADPTTGSLTAYTMDDN